MSDVFQDITLEYGGENFLIAGNSVFKLIAKLESVVSMGEMTPSGDVSEFYPPMTKIATAYSIMLNYAGAKTTAESVYSSMFGSDNAITATAAINGLFSVMIPPDKYKTLGAKDSKEKK